MTDEIRSDIANVWITAVEKGVVAPSLEDENRFRELVRFPTREAREGLIEETIERLEEKELTGQITNDERTILAFKRNLHMNGHQHDHKLNRSKTKAERRVDFKAIESGLDERQEKAVETLAATMREQNAIVKKRIQKGSTNGGLGFKDIRKLELPLKGRLRKEFVDFLKEVLPFGVRTAFNDIKRTRTNQSIDIKPFLTAAEATAFFATKGDFFITGIEDALLAKIKPILLDGIKTGATTAELQRRVDRVFAEWVGSAVEGLSTARLNNVVRTNFTEAFNEGRKMAFNDPDVVADIAGVQFSAILDERTTDVCDQLDGMTFRNDDPDLARFTPPMHFQCRSVLVPVLIDDIPQGGLDFISASRKGSAQDAAQVGFGGESQRPPRAGITSEEGRQRQGA
jgi:SPP1 gp7 family putative phage head morphogenesis protein